MRVAYVIIVACFVYAVIFTSHALAVDVPSTAQVDRLSPAQRQGLPEYAKPNIPLPETKPSNVSVPEAAKKITLHFKGANIEGSTVFSEADLRKLYEQYINRDTTLEVAWIIASKLTEKYNNEGYFLSKAYVPEQEVKDGIITIKVIEGYIGIIELDQPDQGNFVTEKIIKSLEMQRPLKAEQLESFLLKLNDMPGQSFKGVLSSLESSNEAEVKMTLFLLDDDKDTGNFTVDNFGSRYIGPTEMSTFYKTSLLPLNETTATFSSSLPIDEVLYGSIEHSVLVLPDLRAGLSFDKTKAAPGYNLEQFDVDSNSKSIGLNINYQAIRQRQQNLSLKFAFDSKNTNTTVLGNQVSHDQIRAFRANATYDLFDSWNGYNTANLRISKGIDGLGSSDAGDLNLTRASAKPNFQKIELSLQRQQSLADNFFLVTSAAMQKSSGTLYSAEQFGYGGQNYGRAYDSSDILGDNGISAMVELRYTPPNFYEDLSVSPYCFYDVGKIWTEVPSAGEPTSLSASSAGFGARLNTEIGFSGNLGIAFPLTRDVSSPIYWNNKTAPRLLLQISQEF